MQTHKLVRIAVSENHTIHGDEVISRNPATGDVLEQTKRIYKPGETLEVTELEAQRLMDSGAAVPAISPGVMRVGQRVGERLSDELVPA